MRSPGVVVVPPDADPVKLISQGIVNMKKLILCCLICAAVGGISKRAHAVIMGMSALSPTSTQMQVQCFSFSSNPGDVVSYPNGQSAHCALSTPNYPPGPFFWGACSWPNPFVGMATCGSSTTYSLAGGTWHIAANHYGINSGGEVWQMASGDEKTCDWAGHCTL